MTDREAREILTIYAKTTTGGLSQAIAVVLDSDRHSQKVYARLEAELHDIRKLGESAGRGRDV